jgi:hypothetical protein
MENFTIHIFGYGETQINSKDILYEFHFKGVYAGRYLKKVILQARKDLELIRGEEYLLCIQVTSLLNDVLNGTILKMVSLNCLKDKS